MKDDRVFGLIRGKLGQIKAIINALNRQYSRRKCICIWLFFRSEFSIEHARLNIGVFGRRKSERTKALKTPIFDESDGKLGLAGQFR